MKCAWRNCPNDARTNPYKGHEPIYCSKQCKNKAGVDAIKKRVKRRAVDELGGKCSRCGYNRCLQALQFHHLDPSTKEFNISKTTNWEKIAVELKKCVLICANCHAEEHSLEMGT